MNRSARALRFHATPVSLIVVALATGGCRPGQPHSPKGTDAVGRLPTGVVLDPAGRSFPVGSFPLAMIGSPEDRRLVLVLGGYRDQGVQIIDPVEGKVTQTVIQPAAFIGAAFDPSGRRLYASGGDQDVVYRYDWSNESATLVDSLVLAVKPPKRSGTRYPAGLALSPDGALLYVAENLADSLAVIDVTSGQVIQRLPSGRYPYAVVISRDGAVYVSAWGGYEVRSFRLDGRHLTQTGTFQVGRHPSALLVSRDGSRLYVASASTDRVTVVDTRAGRVVAELLDTVPDGTGEGSTPNALALSTDQRRLFVAEADNNAVAVFDLSAGTSGRAGAGQDRLAGRIPVGWYPTALAVRGDTLFVANGKGGGSAPNGKDGPGPGRDKRDGYTLNQLVGSVSVIPPLGSSDLAELSGRVARANHWKAEPGRGAYPPFQHVIYVIKENRTYDQVLGDLAGADGDTSLTFFPRAVAPNHHALAERFGIFDRFLTNSEVSADGHNWTTAAYATDYTEKTLASNYSGRGRSYDYEGTNRDQRTDDDVAAPASGYLWDLAQRRGITFRNFGEFVVPEGAGPAPRAYRGVKPFLVAHTDSAFPGFDLAIPDQRRADLWIAALRRWEAAGAMPALQIVRLPNDHTEGARAGKPTPRAHMADNDLALGRMIEALSKSPFWANTVVFVVEDDAQNGPDHVDSHRAPFFAISAYNRPGLWHRFTNTTDVLATIEEILTLQPLSQFDRFGRPLRGIFAPAADLTPYQVLVPTVSLTETNQAGGPGAEESSRLDFRFEDVADDETFNRVLWLAMKGPDRPYPGPKAMAAPVR